MRLLAACLGVVFVFTVFTVVTVVRTVRDSGSDGYEIHPPESDDERAAARTAEQFSAAIAREDAADACRLAVEKVAREMRCATEPRVVSCSGRTAYHAKEDGDEVRVRLDMCLLRVARRDGHWRVIENVPLVGYA